MPCSASHLSLARSFNAGWSGSAPGAAKTDALSLCFSHGDFTYTQLIFEGRQCGLVDFDTVCQAEPALDLGQFMAYQRLAIRKDQRPDAPLSEAATEQLCGQFLNAYEFAVDERWGDKQRLRDRVAVYEISHAAAAGRA